MGAGDPEQAFEAQLRALSTTPQVTSASSSVKEDTAVPARPQTSCPRKWAMLRGVDQLGSPQPRSRPDPAGLPSLWFERSE